MQGELADAIQADLRCIPKALLSRVILIKKEDYIRSQGAEEVLTSEIDRLLAQDDQKSSISSHSSNNSYARVPRA